MKSSRIVAVYLLFPLLLAACKKTDVAPQTGNVIVIFTYSSSLTGTPYALYTEQVWTSSSRFATPLRTGTIPAVSSGSTGLARIEIDDLNAGNYVFTAGNNNAFSVQVTAGRTNESAH